MAFQPDYRNVEHAARNMRPGRVPLYEHIISDEIIERVLRVRMRGLLGQGTQGKREYFSQYTRFFQMMGYDTVSFEHTITGILPGGGALYRHTSPAIRTREDFEAYPWDTLPTEFALHYFEDYQILGDMMPDGMKAVGGPGNGLFEIVQDLTGYEGLCMISVDDPELYADLFLRVAQVMLAIWTRFLEEFSDTYCVCRFGDDLGYRSQTLLSAHDIRTHIIPRYAELVAHIHSMGKPFLLHSCGCIFEVMEDIICMARIDAKHSNEDAIAPFSEWVERYGESIGNFGGIDTDVLCSKTVPEIKKHVEAVYRKNAGKQGGIAFGSGNSIPEYVPVEGYLAMVETIRGLRGEDNVEMPVY